MILIKPSYSFIGVYEVKFVLDRITSQKLILAKTKYCTYEQNRYDKISFSKNGVEYVIPIWCQEEIDSNGLEGQEINQINFGEKCQYLRTDVKAWVRAMIINEQDYESSNRGKFRGEPRKAVALLNNSVKNEIIIKACYYEWKSIFRRHNMDDTPRPIRKMMKQLQADENWSKINID